AAPDLDVITVRTKTKNSLNACEVAGKHGGGSGSGRLRTPDGSRGIAVAENVFQFLPLFEGIHAGPEPLVRMRHQLPFVDEASERILNQFFAILEVIENFAAQDEKAAIHAGA